MRISEKMELALIEQIHMELLSINQYLVMASYFLKDDLNGFANFFLVQAQEENFHAMKQFQYLHDVGGSIRIGSIPAPVSEFHSIKHVFEMSLAHEKKVTQSISKIIKLALEEQDYATHTFFQWFITEQVEEEALIENIIKKLDMIGDNSSALYLLNDELAKRTFNPNNTV
ncbi:MAG: ferritin [Bacteroidia bacterium]|nr:MAG: ferritin [Bacteroidia bacterium]